MTIASVEYIEKLPHTIGEVTQAVSDFESKVQERLHLAEQLKDETEAEEQTSLGLLDLARGEEAAAQAALIAAEGHLAFLIAGAVENPALAFEIPVAMEAASKCREMLDIAKRHRELMEQRYQLAQECVMMATENLETLRLQLNAELIRTKETTAVQISRLSSAINELTGYSSESEHKYRSEYEKWEKYQHKEKEPIDPDEIRTRLNPGREVCLGLLAALRGKDDNFAKTISDYFEEGKTEEGRNQAILKIRKNMTGRLAEEVVKAALAPFGRHVETQKGYVFDDGTYTKIDLVVSDLVAPIILGRGQGMGAREGGSLGVEVKSGKGSYLMSQMGHLVFQAQGHTQCDVSCTICTRDVKDLNSSAEELLRENIRSAGSPILGMLPYKSELDDICIEFVFGGSGNV